MSVSITEKLRRRKIDALKRGVHRVTNDDAAPVDNFVIGLGGAGAGVVAALLKSLSSDTAKLTALVVDIGEHDLAGVRELAGTVPPERADVTIVQLDAAAAGILQDGLLRYPQFLQLEYPLARFTGNFQPWLTRGDADGSGDNGHSSRAAAKAIYGLDYYDGPRMIERVLRDFAAKVEAASSQAVVSIVFGMGGGAGSGIAVDLSRHLSNKILGRRVLVAGIGIAPCDGDGPERIRQLYPVLNELDCLCDEAKTAGIVASCGELFRNPFTAGFIIVPQQHVWAASGDLATTQARVDQEIAAFLTARGGADLLETLRMLNWVAAPSTQHSAARTPWGDRWIHLLGFADTGAEASGAVPISPDLPARLGLLAGYKPEFIELLASEPACVGAAEAARGLGEAFAPDVPPQIAPGERRGRPDSVQFILPSVSKTDLGLFFAARDAYEAASPARRRLDHSLLLEQGVVLSEPSTRIEGMAGASLAGGESWVAVPFEQLRGGDRPRAQQRRRSDAA